VSTAINELTVIGCSSYQYLPRRSSDRGTNDALLGPRLLLFAE
jgi:hypothetical protein